MARVSALTLQGSHGSWSFPEHFQKSMNEQSASLVEIDCGGEC
jgi:hypothetical protein